MANYLTRVSFIPSQNPTVEPKFKKEGERTMAMHFSKRFFGKHAFKLGRIISHCLMYHCSLMCRLPVARLSFVRSQRDVVHNLCAKHKEES